MAFPVVRVSAALLAALLAVAPASAGAQSRTKEDTQALKMFLHGIAMRRNARVCERGVPEYRETFDDLYKTWSERHRAETARGESVFKDALTKKDPGPDRASLMKVDESLAELAKPPQAANPLTLDARTTAACEKILTHLKTD